VTRKHAKRQKTTDKMKRFCFPYLILFIALLASADSYAQGTFVIKRGQTVNASVGKEEASVVQQATKMLAQDLENVLKATLSITPDCESADLVIETNPGAFDSPKHQVFRLSCSKSGTLKIEGSDAMGTAFGLMELSRRMGVSPWTWWAEAEIPIRQTFTLSLDKPIEEAPFVEHRGIFINDEDWGLAPWAARQEPEANADRQWRYAIGPQVTERICQLLLRLKADTYWPAMHECTRPFFLTQGNREVVQRYGISIGTSHCEPMACNAAGEWEVRGKGEYDFINNREAVLRFWQQRLDSVAQQPIIYTLGMRGVHDGAMQGVRNTQEHIAALEEIFQVQRNMLKASTGKDLSQIPQVFIPYKEVLDAVNAGLRIPLEVAVIQCDDNYGYIRWPHDSLLSRPGGTGLYYHVSYWGRPHDYLWLSSTHPGVMQEELQRFAHSGKQRLWILNVGDIKPAEYQTQLFMDLAWNPDCISGPSGWQQHLNAFLTANLSLSASSQQLKHLTEGMVRYYDCLLQCRPEFLGGTRTEERDPKWKTITDLPWSEEELASYASTLLQLSTEVERREPTTAWFHLVQYPVQGAAQMAQKYVSAQLARHGKGDWATSDAAHDSIQSLTERYNSNRWEGFMDASPRRLPVFNRVPHQMANAPLPAYPSQTIFDIERPLMDIDIPFRTSKKECDNVQVEVSILPTHPRHSEPLCMTVEVDGEKSAPLDFSTQGRSEQWKQNVLRNRATQTVRLPLKKGRRHHVKLQSVSGGEIFPLRMRIIKE